jgi:hypothetical protein
MVKASHRRADTGRMRRAPSLAALLLATLVCGGLAVALAVELRSAVPSTAPAAAIRDAAKTRARARNERFEAQDRSFDAPFVESMVRDRVAWKTQGIAPTLDLAIVNATPGADLAETATACANASGVPKRRVQCYVFASTEAYDYKNITGDLDLAEPTAIVNLCWAVMASNPAPGQPVVVSDMRDAPQTWAAQGCPEGWEGDGW